MFISAGATVPPTDEMGYGFTYNKIAFDWDEESDGLVVEIEARTWDAEATQFAADREGIGRTTETLRCPSFKGIGAQDLPREETSNPAEASGNVARDEGETDSGGGAMAEEYEPLRLRFFTHLTVEQRVSALAKLGVLPHGDWVVEQVTHTFARHLLDTVLSAGRSEELRRAIAAAAE